MAKSTKTEESIRALPDGALEVDFIICDNTVNRYGWRLLVEGIDYSGFLKNPVCCLQHDTYSVPVGKWKNLRVENEQFKGTAEFDRNDEDAVKLYWKYKDGYMSAVSLNVIELEASEEKKYLLPGQVRETLIKSELLEISLVTLPGNKNAVKLTAPDGTLRQLNLISNNNTTMAKEEKTVEQLQAELAASRKLNADNLVALHKQRGVLADGEIPHLQQLALDNYENVQKMLEARPTPVAAPAGEGTASKESLADALVKLHFDRGAISEPEKSIYRLSAIDNLEATRKVLEAKPGRDNLQTFVQSLGANGKKAEGDPNDRSNWTYLDYYKKDMRALALMEKNEPDKFKQLEAAFHAQAIADGTVIGQE